jgi:ech hydrogenase subunit A
MIPQQVIGISILLPFLVALLCLIKVPRLRSLLIIGTGIILSVASFALLKADPVSFSPESVLGMNPDVLIALLDFALLFVIFYISYKLKSKLLITLSLLQIVPLAILELFMHPGSGSTAPTIFADQLSMVMVMVISIIGSLICIYALSYMKKHEDHLHLPVSKQGRFFFYMILFLGAMNGLVLSNSLLWIYFFWEVTTFCSFMLIKHDETEIAKANAKRALWMNMLGGVGFVFALILLQAQGLPLSLQELVAAKPAAGLALLPLALLCFAGFTKAAQVPFQSWLCGAMVAPTPVSALLHSSTMVKAGVYLVLRLAPAFAGTLFSSYVALFGAFTFITTAVLALSQSNGKKILAYSTIGNLGLIIACAGINTPAAMSAAILLIIFHAVSKGLMFLCVGSIEQKIGSRDIEDMRGLVSRMPWTTVVALIGMVTLFLPPFGALLCKWMAIEAASKLPLVVIMIALGSAITVVFWARWAGMLLSSTWTEKQGFTEYMDLLVRIPLALLAFGAVVVSFGVPVVYSSLVLPVVSRYYQTGIYVASGGGLFNEIGVFAIYPVFLIMAAGVIIASRASKKARGRSYCTPYMSGIQSDDPNTIGFVGPLKQWVDFKAGNYYLKNFIGEEKITGWINLIAVGILIVLLAGVL